MEQTILVTDEGFSTPEDIAPALHLTGDAIASDLSFEDVALITVDFPSFADGRGFSVASSLRRLGFTGRLRATGKLVADQYAMARRSGFDEVEIGPDMAARQPEDQWLSRADWQNNDYQARLRG